ncbi:hypothetical protein D5038_19395 [Verminephrobacter aporrectodeae subsp. tuberculatae]|uniref:type II toxin-antitoxin system RelE family toxin n=1 Tax=Verminephrobacter aporrectodeae TaxID=1110389 RepID=UPI0022380FF8|nr:hypothetical protein [Verminephrobacter aporrectodeae]MCW5258427.1 hypothetical protein [Verminephrobacter aporrectodeae subsp. tuberculatae]
MACWTIDYTDSAKGQLRKLDKQMARRIVDFMDERIAARADPRSVGRGVLVVRVGNRSEIYR